MSATSANQEEEFDKMKGGNGVTEYDAVKEDEEGNLVYYDKKGRKIKEKKKDAPEGKWKE